MKNIILIFVIGIIVLFGCGNNNKTIVKENVNPTIRLEGIIVANLNEVCVTFFKVRIKNSTNHPIILLDSNLDESSSESINHGFYLFENNGSTKSLKIDNNFYYRIQPKTNSYYFIGAKNLEFSFSAKDSLLLKRALSKYKLIYNGKGLDLNNLKKSKYVSQEDFDKFVQEKENYLPFKDSCLINIPSDKIKIKYIDKLPVKKKEWDNL